MARNTSRVAVRGTCRAGHTTEAVSDPGRVTWEGPCAHDGCSLKVKGRRIPGSSETDPADTKHAPAGDGADPYEVIEVTYEQQPERREHPEPEPEHEPAAAAAPARREPAGVPPALQPAQPAGEPEREDRGPQPRTGRGRFRSRLVGSAARRRAARGGPEPAPEWRIPGILPR